MSTPQVVLHSGELLVGSDAALLQPGAWLAAGDHVTAGPEGAELMLPDGGVITLAAGCVLCLDADVLAEPGTDTNEFRLHPESLNLALILAPEPTLVEVVAFDIPPAPTEGSEPVDLPSLDALFVASPPPELSAAWGLDLLLDQPLRLPPITDPYHSGG